MTLKDVIGAAKKMGWLILGVVIGFMAGFTVFVIGWALICLQQNDADFFGNEAQLIIFKSDLNRSCGGVCSYSTMRYASLYSASYKIPHDYLCVCDGSGGARFIDLGIIHQEEFPMVSSLVQNYSRGDG